MSKSEQISYKSHIVNLMEEASRERTLEMEAIIKEREIGKEEEKKEQAMKTAENLIQMNIPLEQVSKATGLTIEEVGNLIQK